MGEHCWAWSMNHSVKILYNINYNMLLLLITCLYLVSLWHVILIYIHHQNRWHTHYLLYIYSTSLMYLHLCTLYMNRKWLRTYFFFFFLIIIIVTITALTHRGFCVLQLWVVTGFFFFNNIVCLTVVWLVICYLPVVYLIIL